MPQSVCLSTHKLDKRSRQVSGPDKQQQHSTLHFCRVGSAGRFTAALAFFFLFLFFYVAPLFLRSGNGGSFSAIGIKLKSEGRDGTYWDPCCMWNTKTPPRTRSPTITASFEGKLEHLSGQPLFLFPPTNKGRDRRVAWKKWESIKE